jgi:hypothetical protein
VEAIVSAENLAPTLTPTLMSTPCTVTPHRGSTGVQVPYSEKRNILCKAQCPNSITRHTRPGLPGSTFMVSHIVQWAWDGLEGGDEPR